MAVIVIDLLEPIEIDKQKLYHPALNTSLPDSRFQIARETDPVCERGQRVALGKEQGLLAGDLQFVRAIENAHFKVVRQHRQVVVGVIQFQRLRLEQPFRLFAGSAFPYEAPFETCNAITGRVGFQHLGYRIRLLD